MHLQRYILQKYKKVSRMPNKNDKISALNLPAAQLRIKTENGKQQVFDILRQRFVTLTPEEWVRQHFIHFLIEHKGYPAALLGNEVPLQVGTMKKRCDTVVYGRDAQPAMIVEYKASHVEITQAVFNQICRYNITLRVPYLIVSNGLQHFCCRVDYEKGTYSFLADVPSYGDISVER